MKITESQLEQHVARVSESVTGLPADQQRVCGLMDACQWFTLIEGEASPRAAEALRLLLSEELRPAVRNWYRRFGDDMNATAMAFRERLSKLAGERFG